MIFLSAGHNSQSKTIKQDPGAVGNGLKEGDLTIEFRNLVSVQLAKRGAKHIVDSEEENLSMYLKRIKTGSGSVVIEYHFDAAASSMATGCSALIETEADRLDRAFATELAESTARTLGIRNRGVLGEADSHRGRLGLMREDGIICLMELAFISNVSDIKLYNDNKYRLAMAHAEIISRYENLIS